MKRKLLFAWLALSVGCLTGGGKIMAQNGWDAVYSQTQTLSDDWEPITESTTQGKILGGGGTTTKYYYVTKSLSFTNNRTDNDGNGNSGLKIQGTVYLYVPYGLTITCEGANADGRTGAGAGIELSSGNTLYIIGGGTVKATGGNAANGGNGGNGSDAECTYDTSILGGSGGSGGNGGGGAGAGIGTRGANGGAGGSGGARNGYYGQETTQLGVDGNSGSAGATAGVMGNLYVENGTTVNGTGGAAGSNGSGGGRGKTASQHPGSNVYMASGGGGGGAGGFGGAASNIGTGGPGGGGGGGGAAGNVFWCTYSGTTNYIYHVGAFGGKGGTNANGTSAPQGTDVELTNPKYADIQAGGLRSSASDYSDIADGYESGNGRHDGGSGGACGNAASNGSKNTGTKTYKIQLYPVKDATKTASTSAGFTYNSASAYYEKTYSTSAATNIVLPKNEDGYQWVLITYGKSCAPQGQSDSEFATASKEYYGGNVSETFRTIVLGHVYGDLVFREIPTRCTLANKGNNAQTILEYNTNVAYPVTVRLKDRTLYRDNNWNTICLPFDLTPAQIPYSPLSGASIKKMDTYYTGYYPNGVTISTMNYSSTSPTVILYFENVDPSTETLQAGKPYLVKWAAGSEFTYDGNYADNTTLSDLAAARGIDVTQGQYKPRHELDFANVEIASTESGNWSANDNVTFQGTFSNSATLAAGDKTKLVLGADNKLYYPSENMNVGACRGYFILSSAAAASAPQIVMGIEAIEGGTTSVQTLSVANDSQREGAVYNLNGQRLSAPQKGINIINGKKVVMK